MSIETLCPNGHWLKVKGVYAGKQGLCPICQSLVKVPLSDTIVLAEDPLLDTLRMRDSGLSILMSQIARSQKDLGELVPIEGGEPAPLRKNVVLVGRSKDCDVLLRFPTISRHHAKMKAIGDRWFVHDNNSTNLIHVNGDRVRHAWLRPGDVVAFARHKYKISYSQATLAALAPSTLETNSPLGELVPLKGGDPVPLAKDTVLVGRCDTCDIVLPFETISRQHAELTLDGDHWCVRDNGSKNGVEVNGARVAKGRLEPGDVVAFGNHEYKNQLSGQAPLRFRVVPPSASLEDCEGPIAEQKGNKRCQGKRRVKPAWDWE